MPIRSIESNLQLKILLIKNKIVDRVSDINTLNTLLNSYR